MSSSLTRSAQTGHRRSQKSGERGSSSAGLMMSSHLNWAVSNIQFKHPWVYYSDADEIVTPELKEEMVRAVQDASRPFCGLPGPFTSRSFRSRAASTVFGRVFGTRTANRSSVGSSLKPAIHALKTSVCTMAIACVPAIGFADRVGCMHCGHLGLPACWWTARRQARPPICLGASDLRKYSRHPCPRSKTNGRGQAGPEKYGQLIIGRGLLTTHRRLLTSIFMNKFAPCTCLITGGAGFIGSHLAENLLEGGHRVLVLDNLSTGRWENIPKLPAIPCSISRRASIEEQVVLDRMASESQVIFHLAAAVGVKLIVEQPVQTIETNIRGTKHVLDVAVRYRCRTLVASTSEVYGKGAKVPFAEEDDVLPRGHVQIALGLRGQQNGG